MKRLLILAGIALMLGSLTSCYKDVILPETVADPDGPPQAVSFRAEIEPLVTTKCGITGCHVNGGHKPYMEPGIAYVQIVNGGFVNTSIPTQSKIYQMINGEMREYIPSATDRQKIYDWIRNGAPNN